MTPDEIWLRLMKVNNLYGDRMLDLRSGYAQPLSWIVKRYMPLG